MEHTQLNWLTNLDSNIADDVLREFDARGVYCDGSKADALGDLVFLRLTQEDTLTPLFIRGEQTMPCRGLPANSNARFQ